MSFREIEREIVGTLKASEICRDEIVVVFVTDKEVCSESENENGDVDRENESCDDVRFDSSSLLVSLFLTFHFHRHTLCSLYDLCFCLDGRCDSSFSTLTLTPNENENEILIHLFALSSSSSFCDPRHLYLSHHVLHSAQLDCLLSFSSSSLLLLL